MCGVSLEFTGELNEEWFSVMECVGGSMELDEGELGLRYQVGFALLDLFFFLLDFFVCSLILHFFQSFCNPRLNFEHSLGQFPFHHSPHTSFSHNTLPKP